jgi:hypothetical protein
MYSMERSHNILNWIEFFLDNNWIGKMFRPRKPTSKRKPAHFLNYSCPMDGLPCNDSAIFTNHILWKSPRIFFTEKNFFLTIIWIGKMFRPRKPTSKRKPAHSLNYSCPFTDKKKIKFSSYIRKFRVEQLQSHIWLTASSYMGKYLRFLLFPHILGSPSSYMTLQLLHSEFPYTVYEENLVFFFISVGWPPM